MEAKKVPTLKKSSDSYDLIVNDKTENKLSEIERQELIRSICQTGSDCLKFIEGDLYKSDSEFNFAKNFLLKYHITHAILLYYDENTKCKLSDEDKKMIFIAGLENENCAINMLKYEENQEIRNLLIDSCLNDCSSIFYNLLKLKTEDLDYIYDKLYETQEIMSIPFNYMPKGSKLRKFAFAKKLTSKNFIERVINGNYDIIYEDECEIFHDLYHEEMFKYARRGHARLNDYLKRFGNYLFDYEAEYLIKKELESYSPHSMDRLLNKIYVSENSFKIINTFIITKKMSEGFGGK